MNRWYNWDRETGKVVPTDIEGLWNYNRIVRSTHINNKTVSTVFLALDHNFTGSGAPILWETMIFPMGSMIEEYCARYTSYKEAVRGAQIRLL